MSRLRAVLLASVLVAACGGAPTTISVTDKARVDADAQRQVDEAEAFRLDAQREIDAAEAAVAEAQKVIAAQVPPSTRAPVSARASRSRPAPRPVTPSGAGAPASSGSVWDAIAACESHGNWSTNTGNGYYGGLQENMGFWTTYDGLAFAARPDLASREQQIVVAERARDGYSNRKGEHFKARGYTPWPYCGRRFR